jgi:hypothetical protein
MLVVKVNAAIDARGGIWTKEVVVRRRARLTINQNNETVYNSGSSTRHYEMLLSASSVVK